MASGLDKFPGHAYAPGREPKFWDSFVTMYPDGAIGFVSFPTIALGILALMLVAARVLSSGTRLRKTGNRCVPHRPEVVLSSDESCADVVSVISRTIIDRNVARELRHRRMKLQAGSEHVNAN